MPPDPVTAGLPEPAELAEFALRADLGEPAVVVLRLPSAAAPGAASALDGNRPLYPASMIKVPIGLALTVAWARGERSPGEPVAIAREDLTANDLPSPFVLGYAATLEELGLAMLARSDNVATNVLIRVLGREQITAVAGAAGLARTAVRRKLSGSLPLIDDPQASGRNAHPPNEAARLFERIATGEAPGAAWLAAALAAQEWNGKLSGGLAPGDQFAHKTGDTDEVSHDGGILTTAEGGRFVVVVYAALASPDEGDPRFAAFMRALRPRLT
jgi:beta-lactamase class A